MRRVLLAAVCVVLFGVLSAHAQFVQGERMDGMEITVSPGYSIPLWSGWTGGTDRTEGGISFSAKAYFGSVIVGDDIELDYGAEIGYVPLVKWDYTESWGFGGDTFTYKSNYYVIPIIGQVRYRFGEQGDESYWYATSGIGLYMWRYSWEAPTYSWGAGWQQDSGTESSTGIGLTASFGYKTGMFDINGRWTGKWPSLNLSAGISF